MPDVRGSSALASVGAAGISSMARSAIDNKTKPLGSLGRLEEIAVHIAEVTGSITPRVDPARIIVFAGDHGIANEGVSAYPRSVTREMLRNFSRGGAAINAIARSSSAEVEVIDVGVDDDGEPLENIVRCRVGAGTRSFVHEPAMSPEQVAEAIAVGREAAGRAKRAGVRTLGIGEIGIGNSTSAAALLSSLTGLGAESTVGRGTGISDAILAHKRRIVTQALALHQTSEPDPMSTLRCLGGFEIAAMAGAMLQAGEDRTIVVVDGLMSTVAAMFACEMDSTARQVMFFSHRSAEPGHSIALALLRAHPLLELELRLGEGTGAALALPIIRAAAAILCDMASFDEAGVSRS